MSVALEAFGAAVRAMRAHVDRALVPLGMRLGQYQVLRALWEEDALTPRQLAERAAVEMPTVTRTVQRMVRDGLVFREANPKDARSVQILLTPRGRALREEVETTLARAMRVALEGIDDRERAQLIRMLDIIQGNLRG